MLFLEIGFFCCCCVSFHFISKSFVLQANKRKEIYSPVHRCWPKTLWGGNHQNFDPSLPTKTLTTFHGMNQKTNFYFFSKMADSNPFPMFFYNNSRDLSLGQ